MMNVRFNLLVLVMFFFNSCSQIETINLRKHNFGIRPQKIIWLQIAGLSEEHISLIRFQAESIEKKTSFEESLCLGKAWDYNLFEIRPSAQHGFMSQLTGKMNITNSCQNYTHPPIWKILKKAGYQTYILEAEDVASEESLLPVQECLNDSKEFINDLIFFKMAKGQDLKSETSFHFQDQGQNFENGQTYFDKSCQANGCFASVARNVDMIYSYISKVRGNSLFLIRDFSYQKAIKAKQLDTATEKLVEFEAIFAKYIDLAKREKDILVLITSSAPAMIELPARGKEWEQFIKNGSNIYWRQSSLISPVFAYGAGSENFCGLYDSSDIFQRILWNPSMNEIRLNFLNIF